jgi:hypothetical protein
MIMDDGGDKRTCAVVRHAPTAVSNLYLHDACIYRKQMMMNTYCVLLVCVHVAQKDTHAMHVKAA